MFRPVEMLNKIVMFRPVQEALNLKLDLERAQKGLSVLLPEPLYILFSQVRLSELNLLSYKVHHNNILTQPF